VPLAWSPSSRILTCPSRYAFQDVSALRLLAFFLYPHLLLPMHSLGCECPSLSLSFRTAYLSCPMRSSVRKCPWLLAFCPCPHLSPLMCSPGCEFPSLLLSFCILTCPSRCHLQNVSVPFFLAFLSCLSHFLPTICAL
jgi:hypothetical protein